jgi:hypothetical protein
MGDRANVVVKADGEQVCLYTHWQGYLLPKALKTALQRGEDRWDDFQYLTRIIFCEMVGEDTKSNTGYGITQQVHDGNNQVIIVDVDTQMVKINNKKSVSFKNYIKSSPKW